VNDELKKFTDYLLDNKEQNFDLESRSSGITVLSGKDSIGSIFFGADPSSGESRTIVKYIHKSDDLTIVTNGNNVLRINTNGNVGLASTHPLGKLQVTDNG